MEKEEQKPGPDPLLLALRCSKASLVLSSLRQPPPRSKASSRSSSSSSVEFEVRNARLLDADLAAPRREATRNTRMSTAELLLVIALPLLIFPLRRASSGSGRGGGGVGDCLIRMPITRIVRLCGEQIQRQRV